MADTTYKQAQAANELVAGTPGVNQEQITGTEVVGATSATNVDSGWTFLTLKNWVKLDSDWMAKSVYDANDDGRVDDAEQLNDGTNTVTAAQARAHIDDASIHFVINDLSTAINVAWSGSKINTELGAKADSATLTAHTSNTNNPHSTTHALLPDGGVNSHAVIDTHLGITSGNPHGVTHAILVDKGTNTHAQIDAHIGSISNPHVVTHAQVAPTALYSHSQIDAHINSSANPHGVTAAQAGAAPASHVGDSSHLSSDERDAMNNVSQPLNAANPFATQADLPTGTGHVIQDDGVDLTQRPNLNFVGFTVTDDPTAPTGSATKVEPIITGDVFGPGSSVLGNIATFADTTGKNLQDSGYSMPTGGLTGQVLGKASGSDYDWAWIDQSTGGLGEAPNDTYGYVRQGATSNNWVRGSRVYEQATAPTGNVAVGDIWIDTS